MSSFILLGLDLAYIGQRTSASSCKECRPTFVTQANTTPEIRIRVRVRVRVKVRVRVRVRVWGQG